MQVVNLTPGQLDKVDHMAPQGLLPVQGITKAQESAPLYRSSQRFGPKPPSSYGASAIDWGFRSTHEPRVSQRFVNRLPKVWLLELRSTYVGGHERCSIRCVQR